MIIAAAAVHEFCVEVCMRIGDEYTGPNMVRLSPLAEPEVVFYGKSTRYAATLTGRGTVVTDEAGCVVLRIPDMAAFPF